MTNCAICGNRRRIEFACCFFTDNPNGTTSGGKYLCKDCAGWKNSCHHGYCWQNYKQECPLC